MQKLGKYLLEHRAVTAGVVLGCSLLSLFNIPIAWIGTILIALTTLRCGAITGFYILLWAAIPAIAMTIDHGWMFLLSDTLLGNFIVWAMALILRRNNSWTALLEILTSLGVIAVITINLLKPEIHVWYAKELINAIGSLNTSFNLHLANTNIQLLATEMSKFVVGANLLFTGTILLSYLLIARYWQAKIYNPGGLQKEWSVVRLHRAFTIISITLILTIFFAAKPMLLDIALVLLIAFVFAGLSLAHTVLRNLQHGLGNAILVILYFAMIFLFPYISGLLAIAALTDSWYDLRQRFNFTIKLK
ncbi:MAG: hypothetical protein JXR42_06105 [Gammaproteobacteria bacterium]|nr:hypothetical protein [Gammaproteobacteria bacterium]